MTLLSLGAFVGVSVLPIGDQAEDGDAIDVATPAAGAPEAAALASAPTPVAVAAAPAAAAPVPAPPPAADPPVSGAGGSAPGARLPPIDSDPPDVPGPPTTPPPDPGAAPETATLGGAVGDLDHTVSALGLDLPLAGVTENLTTPLDRTLSGTLNRVGGAVGNPRLGDQVGSTVNGLTGSLLGPGGLTDGLLKRR